MDYNTVLGAFIGIEREYMAKVGSTAGDLMALAGTCNSVDEFNQGCDAAEAWARSEQAGQSQVLEGEKLPRAWIQARSDIKGGMERGLDPKDYDTYSKFKQAKVAAGKKANETEVVQQTTSEPTAAVNSERAEPGAKDRSDAPENEGKMPELPPDVAELVLGLLLLPEVNRRKLTNQWTKQMANVGKKVQQSAASRRQVA